MRIMRIPGGFTLRAEKELTPRWLRQWRHRATLRRAAGPHVQRTARAQGYFFITEVTIMLTVLIVLAVAAGSFYIGVTKGAADLAAAKAELAAIKAKL